MTRQVENMYVRRVKIKMAKYLLFLIYVNFVITCDSTLKTPSSFLNEQEQDSITNVEDDLVFTKLLSRVARNKEMCFYPNYYNSSTKIYIAKKYYSRSAKECVLIVVSASVRKNDESSEPYTYYEGHCFLSIKRDDIWKISCVEGLTSVTDISLEVAKRFALSDFRNDFSKSMNWPYLIDDIRFFELDIWKDEKFWANAVSTY